MNPGPMEGLVQDLDAAVGFRSARDALRMARWFDLASLIYERAQCAFEAGNMPQFHRLHRQHTVCMRHHVMLRRRLTRATLQ